MNAPASSWPRSFTDVATPDPQVRPSSVAPEAVRFESADSRWLLRAAGIGPGVIQRLEAVGVLSLNDLAARGDDRVVTDICTQLRTPA